jgi:hypothetical protein
MKSLRSLNRDLKNISGRIIKDYEEGHDPKPEDLEALKETVDLLVENLKAKP